jgi:hypothetical protein
MKILIRQNGFAILVPGPQEPIPKEGEILREVTEAEQEVIAERKPLMVVDGVLTTRTPSPPPEVPLWRIKAIAAATPHGDGTLLEAIDALVEGTPVSFIWHNGTVLSRKSKTLEALAAELELTAEQLDDMFYRASQIII